MSVIKNPDAKAKYAAFPITGNNMVMEGFEAAAAWDDADDDDDAAAAVVLHA
jgi:hypothetical protein